MRFLRAAIGIGLVVVATAAVQGTARAQAPAQQGWWTASNPGGVQGLPQPPAPPDVPADGLLVEGGPSSTPGAEDAGPNAYAALVFLLAPGSTAGKLVLSVVPVSATTPNATLQLCPLENNGFFPRQGGPIAEGPEFDCSRKVTALPSADGTRYSFDASGLVVEDALAVAVLPTSATDRVVLSAPGAGSLAVQQPVRDWYGDDPPQGTSASPLADSLSAPAPGPSAALPSPPATSLNPMPAPTKPPVVAPGSGTQAQTPVTQLSTAVPSAARTSPALVAALIATACVGWALWTAAGRAAARGSIPL